MGISEILRNKRVSSKRSPRKRVYAITKKIFKAGKVLVDIAQRMNLKMLCQLYVIIFII
jgi:IS5 family transposase